MLNDRLTKSPNQKFRFKTLGGSDGYQLAVQDGIITGGLSSGFTAKGLLFSDGFFEEQLHYEGRFFPVLAKPIEERVAEVTGLALGQNPNFYDVEFVTKYSIPESVRGMLKYIESGRKLKFTLRKYDDGWRVEQ